MMAERRHPIRVIYEDDLGLTRTEFALLCRLAYQRVYLFERGYTKNVPQDILWTLAELGHAPPDIERAHWEYLEELGEEIRQRVLARV